MVIKKEGNEKIKLDKCPFCGCEEYIEKIYMKGMVPHSYKFGTNEQTTSEDKYNYLFKVYTNGYIYCKNKECGKRICKIEDLDR